MDDRITLLCGSCRETFEIDVVEGLNWINRHEDFGEPILCPVCYPEDYEEEHLENA